MKVLLLSPVHPCPADRGSKLRVYHCVERLKERHEVRGISFGDSGPSSPPGAGGGPDDEVCAAVEAVDTPRGRAGAVLRSLARARTYRMAKFDGRAFRRCVRAAATAQDFDLVWVHFLDTLQFLRDPEVRDRIRDALVVLDQHNDIEKLWLRNVERRNPLERAYARWNAARIRSFREEALPLCDAVLSVSEEEARAARGRAAGGSTPVWVVPNGVDADRFAGSAVERPAGARLVFVGSMDVGMNVDAALWFAEEILPKIAERVPEVELEIVGRNPTPRVRALADDDRVRVTGWVERVDEHYERASVAVVPLRFGGGTKLKVAEAMAAGVPVVATPVGAQGFDLEDGVHLRIAEGEEAFSEAVVDLLRDRGEARRLARAARQKVRADYSWSGLYDPVIRRLEEWAAGA